MKNFVYALVLVFILLPTVNAFSRTTKVIKAGGTTGGYYSVTETHSDGFLGTGWGASSTLDCQGNGAQSCTWINDPGMKVKPDPSGNGGILISTNMFTYALSEIANSNLSGTYTNNVTFEGRYIYQTVTWVASDSYNNEITLTQYQANGD